MKPAVGVAFDNYDSSGGDGALELNKSVPSDSTGFRLALSAAHSVYVQQPLDHVDLQQ